MDLMLVPKQTYMKSSSFFQPDQSMIYGVNSLCVTDQFSRDPSARSALSQRVGMFHLALRGRGDFDCLRNSYSRTLC